jgi:hypothetical protein
MLSSCGRWGHTNFTVEESNNKTDKVRKLLAVCFTLICSLVYSSTVKMVALSSTEQHATYFALVSGLILSSTLKMKAICSSETSVELERARLRFITEDTILRNYRFADDGTVKIPERWLHRAGYVESKVYVNDRPGKEFQERNHLLRTVNSTFSCRRPLCVLACSYVGGGGGEHRKPCLESQAVWLVTMQLYWSLQHGPNFKPCISG